MSELTSFKVACLQMSSNEDVEHNWQTFEGLALQAIQKGAQCICTPENTFYLGGQFHKVSLAESLDGPMSQRCSQFAKKHAVFLFIGSIAEEHFRGTGERNVLQCYNTSIVFNPEGTRIAQYRKIHLFDVDIPNGLRIAESDRVIPGEDVVVVPTHIGNFGLSICYDLRFPELYRSLQAKGANIILVPAAFTDHTGQAHWHTLLRARAIETQSWVIAAAQTGIHDKEGKRHSYGHALIIDPWGRVVEDAHKEVGFIIADISIDTVSEIRQSMPVEHHRRL